MKSSLPKRITMKKMKGHQTEWMKWSQDTGVIEMHYFTVEEIKEELKQTDNLEFLKYLGIDSDDFKLFNEDIDFDDYSA